MIEKLHLRTIRRRLYAGPIVPRGVIAGSLERMQL
jgi:hypothetical protein